MSGTDQINLRQWLFEKAQHVESFVAYSYIHSQLMDWIGPEPTRVSEILAAEALAAPAAANAHARTVTKTRPMTGRVLALAIVFMGVLAGGYMFFDRIETVASVSGTRNVHWVKNSVARKVGSLLSTGDEVAIEDGVLHIVFAHGGQVAVQGPARFRIESDKAGRLLTGRLCAFTPEHAVGFTIHSARLAAVDLGTEFYLEHQPDDFCLLEVFDGLVEVQLDGRSGKVSSDEKLQIPEGRAIRYDSGTGKFTSIEYDKTKRLPESTWAQ